MTFVNHMEKHHMFFPKLPRFLHQWSPNIFKYNMFHSWNYRIIKNVFLSFFGCRMFFLQYGPDLIIHFMYSTYICISIYQFQCLLVAEMYWLISKAILVLIFVGRSRLWLRMVISIGIVLESMPLSSAWDKMLFHMFLLWGVYLGQFSMKWEVSSIAPQLSHLFSSTLFLSIGSWSLSGPLPILNWWKVFCINLDGGSECLIAVDISNNCSFYISSINF